MGRKPKSVREGVELKPAQKNLQRFRVRAGLSQFDLDDYTEMLGGRGRTQKYESGEAEPPQEYINLISLKLGVKPVEFLETDDNELPPVEVPYWGLVPCGNWEAPTSDTDTRPVPGKLLKLGDIVAVSAAGPSMKPRIQEGETVAVLLTRQYSDGSIALIHNEHGELSLKRTKLTASGWEFQSINPEFPPVTAEKVTMLGKVVWMPESYSPEGIAA